MDALYKSTFTLLYFTLLHVGYTYVCRCKVSVERADHGVLMLFVTDVVEV